MPYLWTFEEYEELGISNTNNALEGMFKDLKTKLRNHSSLKKDKRRIFMDKYFNASFEKNPLKQGWENRESIYSLYHVMHHLNLFGTSCRNHAISLIKRYF